MKRTVNPERAEARAKAKAEWLLLAMPQPELTALVAKLRDELNEARTEIASTNALFDLQHARMVEAMKRWRAADPNDRALKTPDFGALLDFMHTELTDANATIAALREALSGD